MPDPIRHPVQRTAQVDVVLGCEPPTASVPLALVDVERISPFCRRACGDRVAIMGDQRSLDAALHAAVASRRLGWASQ
jgi:hypothetical protein